MNTRNSTKRRRTHKTPSAETPSEVGHQLVDHDFSFFFALMRHVEVGHQLVGKISMLRKTVKTQKNTIGKKIIILFLLILMRKALNLPKVIYVLGTLIYFCKIISCMLCQSNLPFLLRNKVQCLTVGYMKMKLVYHVLSFFCIMLHS